MDRHNRTLIVRVPDQKLAKTFTLGTVFPLTVAQPLEPDRRASGEASGTLPAHPGKAEKTSLHREQSAHVLPTFHVAKGYRMRFVLFFAMLVIGIIMLAATPDATAKHHHFANVHPLVNHVQRCLGIGWSDGYHAVGGWARQDCWKPYGSSIHATRHPKEDVSRPALGAPTFQQPPRLPGVYGMGN